MSNQLQPSPRRRNLSDSLDYDDELAELMSNSRVGREREVPLQDSDEDTEDASEDGGEVPPPDEGRQNRGYTNIKEQ